MHDAHFHMTETLFSSLKTYGMQGIANAGSTEEYRLLTKLQQEYSFFISAGVHPWYASMDTFQEMKEWMKSPQVSLVGEIGLDNVWCDTDMEVQRAVFEAQLAFACEIGKPVILHTKGMEEEIAQRIRQYPNTYVVHWYSSMEHLEKYLDLDCYYTIGPSVGLDEAVTRTAEQVPLDRMLIETDGISAIDWVYEAYPVDHPQENLHQKTLERSIRELSRIRGMEPGPMEILLDRNFSSLFSGISLKKN